MSNEELKHVIALLLEDAKRLQKIEPNAGTEARIWIAKEALSSENVLLLESKSNLINEIQLRLESVDRAIADKLSLQPAGYNRTFPETVQ
ncbi:hypothetical protein [Mixta intestinalis]|uniref:Uncharacterized protein n=1 Tax=Mixta intestinalis TaxID=1615494 RepID=A0A6P1PWD8_9GAMM|nr:hypothetical protein [Mixta intestinalis]QHM70683.1 hypothetical protein C7M51_00961 [Mixta intestinalis]